MYAANRSLKPDDITLAFERYRKLSQQTARNIVAFYERRLKLRAKSKNNCVGQKKELAGPSTEDGIVVLPSPSLAPI
jgi:hypothetical protein